MDARTDARAADTVPLRVEPTEREVPLERAATAELATAEERAAIAEERAAASARAMAEERERAAIAEERAAADARKLKILTAELAALRATLAAAPPIRAPHRLRSFPSGMAAIASAPPLIIDSPAKALDPIQLTAACLDAAARPLSPALAHLSAAPSLECWHSLSASSLLQEETGYPFATSHVPAWVECTQRLSTQTKGSRAASTLYLPGGMPAAARPAPLSMEVPWGCYPEVLAWPREPFHPAFSGELKSAGMGSLPRMFDEILTYAMLGMLGSYFQGEPPGTRRFFRAPPHAFSLAAFPHVGYVVLVEWVGHLHGCVVSEPFFLGSPAHAAAMAALPDSNMGVAGCYVDVRLDTAAVVVWPEYEGAQPGVMWRVAPPDSGSGGGGGDNGGLPGDGYDFFKVIFAHAFPAPFFRRLHAAYAAYAAACAAAASAAPGSEDSLPASLVPAELLFGAGAVCVRMPWVRGRDALPAELGVGGAAVEPVARAVLWLARRGLLYTDLREPNVRVEEGVAGAPPSVVLVDYDDMEVVGPVQSAGELLGLLEARGARFVGEEAGARPAVVEALRRLG